MSTKTTFWYAAVVALAVIGSTVAVPLSTIDAPVNKIENAKLSSDSPSVAQEQVVTSSDTSAVSEPTKAEFVEAASPFTETDPSLSTTVNDKIDTDVVPTADSNTAAVNQQTENADGPIPSTVGTGSQSPDASVVGPSGPPKPEHEPKPPKPTYYPGDVYTVKFGTPSFPLLMDFFQPFQAFPPFQPISPFIPNNRRYPYQQFPSEGSVDPFNPFANPMPQSPSFSQLVNAYTNEFKMPGFIIAKPKRHVGINTTSIPPIPLLMNIMLNAFRHQPTDMLLSLDKDMSQMENTDKEVPDKPISTTRTEYIDGHKVQINETTYSNGDANHKSFYHFKEVRVVPEGTNDKKIADENVVTPAANTDETQKVETNEVRPIDTSVETFAVNDDKQNSIKKTREPVPLDDYYQTAASKRYAPSFIPYGSSWYPSAAMYNYNRPLLPPPPPAAAIVDYNRPPPSVSLHGDTYVNELIAAQQQANGMNVALPPDVEIVDLSGKPQQTQGGQFYYNNHHNGPKKFAGRKN